MPYYLVAHYTVADPATFATYPPVAIPTILQHGGKLLMAASPGMAEVNNQEGTSQHTVTAVLEIPSAEACQGWYTSPEY